MKKIKKTVLAGIILAMCGQTAFAAPLSADALYRSRTNRLELSGKGAENSEATVVIMPYDQDETALTIEQANAGSAIFQMLHSDASGDFTAEMGLKSDWNGGMYKAVVSQGKDSVVLWFPYAKSGQLAEPLSRINRADAAGITAILKSDGAKLGADSALVSAYGSEIGLYLYTNRPKNGYDAEGYLKAYTAGLALAMIKDGVGLTQVAENLSGYMGLDSAEYALYSKSVKQELERLLKNADMTEGTLEQMCETYLLLAKINGAESDTALQSVVLEHKSVLGLSMTAYNQLSTTYQKLSVFTTMRGKTYGTYQAVREAFALACADAANAKPAQGGNLGGSSGGLGGGVSGGSTSGGGVYGNIPEKEEYDQKPIDQEPLFDIRGHWGEAAIRELADKEILAGYPDGRFLPDAHVSRAEFSKMICTALELGEAGWSNVFYDVSRDDWHAPYVLRLSDKGIVTGFDGRFLPDALITREDAAVILYRALTQKGVSAEAEATFLDEGEISDYAKDAVKKLAGLQVINGFEGRFAPKASATRAEAAAMMVNVLHVLSAN